MRYDLCIHNARVMDPASGADFDGAVAVRDGRIAYVGAERTPDAARMIDAHGRVLAPGFLDVHTHEDDYSDLTETMLPVQLARCALRTGVTTIVTGNCGMSSPDPAAYRRGLDAQGVPIRCEMLMGNATLRRRAGLGPYDTASPAQIDRMGALYRAALDAGAIGISFGLQYDPGTAYAEERVLCAITAERAGIMAVHMRWDYPEKADETLEEMLSLARETGVRTELSHIAANLYGDGVLARADRAIRASGGDISCDMYPCNVWATVLQSAVFDGGFAHFHFGVEDLEILTGPYTGQACTPALFETLRAAPEEVRVACHNAMPMADVEAAYRLPYCMLGSDGQMRRTPDGHIHGHPRGAGSPARLLGEFVREKKLFSLMEGLRKLTALPAARFRFPQKGRLEPGADADLVLFDPETVADRAAFGVDACATPPAGISCVVAGGRVRFEGGA